MNKPTILFSQTHYELVRIPESDDSDNHTDFAEFFERLQHTYCCHSGNEVLQPENLAEVTAVVVGAPFDDLQEEETTALKQFVARGGGLLLISNADIAYNPPEQLRQLLEWAGVQIQEYVNYPPESLRVFRPHVVTTNLAKIRVGKLAHLRVFDAAKVYPVAFTKATEQPIIAVSVVDAGRVGIIGDSSLFTNELFTQDDNLQFVENLFAWLTKTHDVDIEVIKVQEQFDWGRVGEVEIVLKNLTAEPIRHIQCILSSDNGADIEYSAKDIHDVMPNKAIVQRWRVKPTALGDQGLRLSIFVNDRAMRFNPLLPAMVCLAPGSLSVAIRNGEDELCTHFRTGDIFQVEGGFHWETGIERLPYELDLAVSEGLTIVQTHPSSQVHRWEVKAQHKGTQTLTLNLLNRSKADAQLGLQPEANLSLPAAITVRPSIAEQIDDIYVDYVLPLDAQIAAHLRRVHPSLVAEEIRSQRFEIVEPYQFVEIVHGENLEMMQKMKNLITSAYREKWYNLELINAFLTHITPVYMPNRGSVIPCEPILASHLSKIYTDRKKEIEYSLLFSEESEDAKIKQNIAAYLLHEKYGHGFFYNQTKLGKMLLSFGGLEQAEIEVANYIYDSSILVNEGFATWLELTFLSKLDREIRLSVQSRYEDLIHNSTNLLFITKNSSSDYFSQFPPSFYSPYREGWEHLSFISDEFGIRCAFWCFKFATDIIDFDYIKKLFPDYKQNSAIFWISQKRLEYAAEQLKKNKNEAIKVIKRECSAQCLETNCPLTRFMEMSYESFQAV